MVGQKNVDLASRFCLNHVASLLENGVFWEKCEINRSPGDGHCLLHSIISSIAFQNGTVITLTELIQAIMTETKLNSSEYDFINGSSCNLWSGLTTYVNEKEYESLFCDLVPHIIANAIFVNIIIVTETESHEYIHYIPCNSLVTDNNVVIYKKGEHYDGIKPTFSEYEHECHRLENMIYVTHSRDNVVPDLNGSMHESVRILSMNVCGLSDWKLGDGILGSHFKRFDIILLQETWSAEGDEFNLNGYEFYNFPRKYRHKLSVRNSGGLGIFVNQRLTKGVQILKHHEDILVWLKLKRNSFGLTNDLYIANVYVVPENSVHLCHDAFDMLREDLCGFPPHSDFLICGDYNARTNVLPDYLLDEHLCGNDGDIPVLESANYMRSELLRTMAKNKQLERYSKDTSRVNKHGANLLELCQTVSLLIINGR